ncbi:uncharacterized protein BDW43DRAFT_31909 [Aspergillus alliaceus]|uniref:uncharacterized protein n=1 Tax=Petromyces alliaceus TaxID=209559 RepID=UPI0012A6FD5D|nr:uncharacterized protein BDW43DRAFT_31909 [Aspergillus alliaceus]KAB8235381.1 hypothetical protein BDW43DRAFT_31909 [Aspergillus alliaceus]
MYNRNVPAPGPHSRNPIVIDDESEDDDMNVDYSGRQTHPPGIGLEMNRMRGLSNYHTTIEQEKKVRSRLREERHAALCVLMDRELLTVQALAAQETLPQARRRFLSKLIAPEDPEVAASIRSDIFIVQNQSSPSPSSNSALVVHRSVVDVHETDDDGWRRPTDAGGSASAFSSPASSSKNKGRLSTPDRARGKGKAAAGSGSGSGSAGRGQHLRERERRRRWSGAEREDEFGVSSS